MATPINFMNPYANVDYTGDANIEMALAKQAQAYNQQMQAMLGQQKQEQEGLFKGYEEQIAGQEKLGDAYTRLQTEAGLPEIQKQVDIFKGEIYKTKDLIDRLEENITARNKGFNVTEAQRQRQVAYEGAPLSTTLSRLGTAAQPYLEQQAAKTGEVSTRLGLLGQQQQKELLPQEARISSISDRFAREMTGFTQGKEVELNALVDKVQRNRELQDREWQRLQDLAREEREFARQKQLAALEHRYSMSEKAYGASQESSAKKQAALAEAGTSVTNFFKSYSKGGKIKPPSGITEGKLIPTLVNRYAPYGVTRQEITDLVYPFRKQYLKY